MSLIPDQVVALAWGEAPHPYFCSSSCKICSENRINSQKSTHDQFFSLSAACRFPHSCRLMIWWTSFVKSPTQVDLFCLVSMGYVCTCHRLFFNCDLIMVKTHQKQSRNIHESASKFHIIWHKWRGAVLGIALCCDDAVQVFWHVWIELKRTPICPQPPVTGLLSIFVMKLSANAGIYEDFGPVCVQVCMQRPKVSMGVVLSMIHLCPQMLFFLNWRSLCSALRVFQQN